jgi:hypothetical protein
MCVVDGSPAPFVDFEGYLVNEIHIMQDMARDGHNGGYPREELERDVEISNKILGIIREQLQLLQLRQQQKKKNRRLPLNLSQLVLLYHILSEWRWKNTCDYNSEQSKKISYIMEIIRKRVQGLKK